MRGQRGGVMLVMALVGVVMVTFLMVPLVAYAGTVLQARQRLIQPPLFYARDGGIEWAIWRLMTDESDAPHDAAFLGKVAASGTADGMMTLATSSRSMDVAIKVTKLSDTPGKGAFAPPQLFATVDPPWANVGANTELTYSMELANAGASGFEVARWTANVDSRFSYLVGTDRMADGTPLPAPAIMGGNAVWDFDPPLAVPALGRKTLTFKALAPSSLKPKDEGVYFFDATVKLNGMGLKTGRTAPVQVIPADANDLPIDVDITYLPSRVFPGVPTDFVYTTAITNNTGGPFDVRNIEFWATQPFDNVALTGRGCADSITSERPAQSRGVAGSSFAWVYKWTFAAGVIPMAPGDSKELCFTVPEVTLGAGIYYSAVIVNKNHGRNTANAFTGPIAPVALSGLSVLIESTATDQPSKTSKAIVTLLPDGVDVNYWEGR